MEKFTFEQLVQEAKQSEAGIVGTYLPMIDMHYIDFAHRAGLSEEQYPTIKHYIKNATYKEKRELFESLGFDVLYMTLSNMKVLHKARDTSHGTSIDQAFLNKERNVFLLHIEGGYDTLIFMLEYQDKNDPLADHTVDYEEVEREKQRKEEIRNLFNFMKK